jgi:hypothetical protein
MELAPPVLVATVLVATVLVATVRAETAGRVSGCRGDGTSSRT